MNETEIVGVVDDIYTRVRLDEGRQKLRDFFIGVYLCEGISVKEMSWRLHLPVPVVSAIKNESKKHGMLSAANGMRLTETGAYYVRAHLRYGAVDTEKLLQVLNAPDIPLAMFEKETAALEALYQARPSVDVTVDQSLCTAETGIKRALLMLRAGGLIGRRVLLAGDDDLTSVAVWVVLRALLRTADPKVTELTVMDIDKRVLGYIAEVTASLGASVGCLPHDFRLPVPEAHRGFYDAVFTDPPYTLPGLTLFTSRGVQALKPEPDLHLYLSHAHKNPQTRLATQRMLAKAGLVINRIYESFNRYHGAQILGGVSDLTVLTTTAETVPPISNDFNEALYTNELNRSVRLYVCRACQAEHAVGYAESIPTIERLKESGCSQCGGQNFTLKQRRITP